jgi:type I restriction enzyme S subunit
MELKPGYKQTEVGVIPEDWDVKPLESLVTLLTNGFVGTATSSYTNADNGILYIQGYNVEENGFNLHGIKHVSREFAARNKKSCLQVGDLLTIQTGDIGTTTIVPPEFAGANCHALIITRFKRQESAAGYYCQYFNSGQGRSAFKQIETGTTMKHLNGGDMKRLPVPCPPVEEQHAIATVLNGIDAYISELDRLISKKQGLKQAAMQELLTGKRRLPGHEGEWEAKTLAELENIKLVKLSRGKVISKKDIDDRPGEFPIYSSSIQNNGLFGHFGGFMFDEELITWSVDGGGDFFYRPKHRFSVTNVCGVMQVDSSRIDCRFLAAELQFLHSRKNFDYLSKAHPSVIRKEYELRLPSLSEQTAIAVLLADMDNELAVLEYRKNSTRLLKQGMAQELLAGRTRFL